MCFSATASFTAASILSAGGVTAWKSVRRPEERGYALLPALFAAHQLVEGGLWLAMDGTLDASWIPPLSTTFAVVAFLVWPTLVPFTVLSMETHRWRRQGIWACAALGLFTSVALTYAFVKGGIEPAVTHAGIDYNFVYRPAVLWNTLYGAAVCIPCWLSKYFWVRIFGVALAVSYQVAFRFFHGAYESVWCYFAAALSLLVLAHLRRWPPESPALRRRHA